VRTAPRSGGSEELSCDILYLPELLQAQAALEYVERRLAFLNIRGLERRLDQPGPAVTLIRHQRQPLISAQIPGGISLAAVVPLILILMTITGAVYPAIDLTAGERERGTLEILVAAPVPRLGLLFAKYVSVVTVAVLTAVINLTMMMVTLTVSGLGPLVFKDSGLTPELVVQLFVLLLLFAAFFSAVLLALSSFARSFKEAQAYLIPLMLVSLAPGLVGLLPGLRLSGLLAVAPLVNIVLLGRDLFEANADHAIAIVVVLSTLLYAAAAIAVAARIFGSEGVLYNEQSGWSDLFRRPAEPQPAPTLAAALFGFALLFPATFVLQGFLIQFPAGTREIAQFLVSAALFAGIPLVALAWRRVPLSSGLQWYWPALPAVLGGLLLGPALVPWTYELLTLWREWGLMLLGTEHEERIRELAQTWLTQSPMVIAGSFAAVGMVEELFFRGFLFSALRHKTGPLITIVVSALLFGLSHFLFAFDRLVPSTLLGLVLGWLCWTTRSVIPGMVLHASYNAAFIALLTYYQPADDDAPSEHAPLLWLAVAGVLIGVAVALVQLSAWRRREKP
jgi:ABC-2 type transport system permease protein/sodium transport system permease protein